MSAKAIGIITEVQYVSGAVDGMICTARITDVSLAEHVAQRFSAGLPVGISLGFKGKVHELTRWQSFRFRLGERIIELGKRVRG